MAGGPPPPPPPPPNVRGPPPPPAGFTGRPAHPPAFGGPIPPPGGRPGPPPGFAAQMPPPMQRIKNSIKYSDVTPRTPKTEEESRKKLTTYLVYTIRKHNAKNGGTWAQADVHQEAFAQEDIVKDVKRLNDAGPSAAEKKARLYPYQQTQVTRALDNTMNEEPDRNFEWSLAQLDREERKIKGGKKETTTISVYLKRAPHKDLSAIALSTAIDRANSEMNERLMRPPPPQPVPVQHHGAGPAADAGIVKLDGNHGTKRDDKRRRSRDDSSSSGSDSDSDDSRSSYGTDSDTQPSTISSTGSHRRRRSGHQRRSHSRRRPIHRQHYINERRIESPERRYAPERAYVPEIPRAVVPMIDPVAAAYQAGRNDNQAERFGLDRPAARLEPRAVVSYGAPHFDERYDEPRYMMREDYGRAYPRDDYVRQRREAEEYMERRPRMEQYYEEPRAMRRSPSIREPRDPYPVESPYREPRFRDSAYRDPLIRDIPLRPRYAPSDSSWSR
ncbi:hypothetical protein PVAG01_05138 [Phlyctema vagabunda]|uniref:Uncharacterized protein n=1 Tax=Phlyctema vagabunda TaxID=108571 RepID=A0ABR4PJ75_9HELO